MFMCAANHGQGYPWVTSLRTILSIYGIPRLRRPSANLFMTEVFDFAEAASATLLYQGWSTGELSRQNLKMSRRINNGDWIQALSAFLLIMIILATFTVNPAAI